MPLHRRQRPFRTREIERNFRGVYLQGKIGILFFKFLEDRAKTLREILKAFFPISLRCGRKTVNRMPDG